MLSLFLATALALCGPREPAIAIVIDDLGYRFEADFAALNTPGLNSFAILPFTPLAERLAEAAHAADKEVIIHLPLEADNNNHLLGPGALTTAMSKEDFTQGLDMALASVPHRVGLNNHMGSRISRDAERMRWLMEGLAATDNLFYVDSRTTQNSVARQAAHKARVPFVQRDIFLDNELSESAINSAFDQLIERARERGYAIGIGHPHAQTLKVLAQRLATLKEIKVARLGELVLRQRCAQLAARVQQLTLKHQSAPQGSERRRHTDAAEEPHLQR